MVCSRILSRPWQLKDDYIADLFTEFLRGRNSIVQKIWNSPTLTSWFDEFVKMSGHMTQASKLRAAKHRFETWSKPLGRCILHLDALFRTAHKIASLRTCEEASYAIAWLQNVTSESLVQLAMCADAADEGLQLIRFADDEDMDISAVLFHVGQFLARVDALFIREECFRVQGYTRHCMDILAKGQLAGLGRHGPRELSTVTTHMLARCLDRMRCWVALAHDVTQAEFPGFALSNAFGVLNLASSHARQECPGNLVAPGTSGRPAEVEDWGNLAARGTSEADIARLAQAFKLDHAELASQLQRMKPIAESIMAQTQCDNREAWVKTWQQTQKTTQSRIAYPGSAVGKVLRRR